MTTAAINRFYPLSVTAVRRTTHDALIITLDAGVHAHAFQFQAGQYLTLRALIAGREERRSYSICSASQDQQLQIGIKRVHGGCFSSWAMNSLSVGDTLEVMAPVGRFGELETSERPLKHLLAIAAGSGITPILSILKSGLAADQHTRFTLIYGNRSSASIMFREELEDLKNRYVERVNLVHVLSREQQDIELFNGRLDERKCAEILRLWLGSSEIDAAFLCGPIAMMEAARSALLAHGLTPQRVRLELFAADEQAAREHVQLRTGMEHDGAARTVQVALDGRTHEFQVQAQTETLLEAGLNAGVEMPYSCRGGVCATCVARLLEGEVEMDANFALEDYEVARGYILCCQSYALTERVVVAFEL